MLPIASATLWMADAAHLQRWVCGTEGSAIALRNCVTDDDQLWQRAPATLVVELRSAHGDVWCCPWRWSL
jgi:hypothetical protein